MSNRRNVRRGGPGRRYEKGRKPKKVSGKAEAITAQIAAERKLRAKDKAWRAYLKSPACKRWRRHGKWLDPRKGGRGTKKRRKKQRAKMVKEQNRYFSKATT